MVDSNQPRGEARIFSFPPKNEGARPPVQPISEVYTPLLVDFYSELGVPDQFLAMMGRYLVDTRVSVSNQGVETEQEVVRAWKTEDEFTWQRQTRLSLKHISMLGYTIGTELDRMGVNKKNVNAASATVFSMRGSGRTDKANRVSTRTRTLRTIATNMAFLETSADALGNCVYMQHRYDHYIPDFNGNYYKAYDSVSREFWDSYAYRAENDNHEVAIAQDHRDLRSGVALLFLADDLLRYELVGTMTEARWVTRAVANNYPTPRRHKTVDNPMSEADIKQRCVNLYVRPRVLLDNEKHA